MPDVLTLLTQRLRRDPGAPFVTSIVASTRERTELSTASLANAAAKIGNALRDEFDLGAGDRVGLHLPLHWQRTCWLAGAWTAGCLVVPQGTDVDLVVTSAGRAEDLLASGVLEVAVVSLHPFGLPLSDALPLGAFDVTVAVRQQPDAYLHEPPDEQAPALAVLTGELSQAEAFSEGSRLAAGWGCGPGGRLLVDAETTEDAAWLAAAAVPLASGTSVVLVDGAGQDLAGQERVTAFAR